MADREQKRGVSIDAAVLLSGDRVVLITEFAPLYLADGNTLDLKIICEKATLRALELEQTIRVMREEKHKRDLSGG